MTNNLLHEYQNGNVHVKIYEDGTKIREWPDDEKPISEYPESCDLKITQYCDMDAICVYCHEMSNKQGQHGDLDAIDSIWASQKPGTELAIGGGNPLAHPGLGMFLQKMSQRGIIANVTVNIMHMKKFAPMIDTFQCRKWIHGLGISYRGPKSLALLPDNIDYKNVVFHMIMGIHDLSDCQAVIAWCKERNITPKILLLGYKTFGNGIHHYTPELRQTLDTWKNIYLRALLNTDSRVVVSFDNLAISQLDLKSQLKEDAWNDLFQGEDGNHTFYIDAVKKEVARTSTSDVRYTYSNGDDIRDLFSKVKVAA
jgi:hypothetical protein